MPHTAAPDLSCLPFFASLPAEALQRLQSCLVRREVEADQEIVRAGVRGAGFCLVESGLVCLERADGGLRSVSAGGSFGESMLRYDVPSAFSARTLAPTVLWTLSHADWVALRQPASAPILETHSNPVISIAPPQPSGVAEASSLQPATPRDASPRRSRWSWMMLALAVMILVLLVAGPQLATAGGGWLALKALDAQRPAEASLILSLALAVQPESAALHDSYGYLLFRQGRLEVAQAEFERALRLNPELASALNNLGVTLLARGHPEQAVQHLAAASQLDPGDPTLQINLGNAYQASGDLDSAMQAYQRAINLDPSQQTARSRWASLALQAGELEAARQAWLEVIHAQPLDAQAQMGLGLIALREGRPAAAAQHLQSARQADPGDPLIRLYLGLALQAIDRPEKAAQEFEQALILAQDAAVLNLAQENLFRIYQVLTPNSLPLSAGVEGGEQPLSAP
jgi:Tfp pilus assembly protein PilF